MKYFCRTAIFTVAFLLGSALVLPPMPEIEPISDEVTFPTSCYLPVPDTLQGTPTEESKRTLTIEIRRHDPEFQIEERSISVDPGLKSSSTDVALDLSETIENQLIILHPIPYQQQQEYKIEQQFENSMALGAEGPHYDLDHWKHYTSPWQVIESTGRNRFIVRSLSEDDYARFPKVSTQDIVDFLKKDGASKRWIDLARTCKSADSGACYTTASRIGLRISTKEGSRWKLIHTINFSIPMGC